MNCGGCNTCKTVCGSNKVNKKGGSPERGETYQIPSQIRVNVNGDRHAANEH